jgi:WD40 repeat protein
MRVLEAGSVVTYLQFLPDSRRLVVALDAPQRSMNLEVWSLPGSERVRLRLPKVDPTYWQHTEDGPWIAIHPSGDWCYVAWNERLYSFDTSDGTPRPVLDRILAHSVIISPDGERVVTAYSGEVTTFAAGKPDTKVSRAMVSPKFRFLAGFLPDGKRMVWVEEGIRIGTPGKDYDSPPGAHKCLGSRPQMSPDGRYLALLGYSSMYLYDLPVLGKPRQIKSSSNFGDFRSLAFHPDGKTMAMIHGGPTLVKVYDLTTLRLKDKYQWKVGQLNSVAYSPDGLLGAAGSRDGKVVVWDVEG